MAQSTLRVYREVLRATRLAFQGDRKVLQAARQEAHTKFADIRLTTDEVNAALQHAQDVAKFLRQNIVQGVRETEEEQERYKLRIHKETERGDNESVKTQLKGRVGKFRETST